MHNQDSGIHKSMHLIPCLKCLGQRMWIEYEFTLWMNFEMVSTFGGHIPIMIFFTAIDGQKNGKTFWWNQGGLLEDKRIEFMQNGIYWKEHDESFCLFGPPLLWKGMGKIGWSSKILSFKTSNSFVRSKVIDNAIVFCNGASTSNAS